MKSDTNDLETPDVDIRALLDHASSTLPDRDVAAHAWARAYADSTRLRRLIGGAAAASIVGLGATAVWFGVVRRADDLQASPVVSVSSNSSGTPTTPTPASGTDYDMLPRPSAMDTLAPYGLRSTFSGTVNLAASAISFEQVGGFQPGELIEAAFVDATGNEIGVVTSHRRTMWLDTLNAQETSDSNGNRAFSLSIASISADGTMLAIDQPGGVLLVDATQSGVTRPWRMIVIDDPHIEAAAFVGPTTILAGSDTATYRIELADAPGDTDRITSFEPVWDPGPVLVRDSGDPQRPLTIQRWNPTSGSYDPPSQPELPVRSLFGVAATAADRSSVAVLVAAPEQMERAAGAYQAILLVRADGTYRLLGDDGRPTANPANDNRSKGGITPLGFTADGQLLIYAGGSWDPVLDRAQDWPCLVAWNPTTGQLTRVATLQGRALQLVVRAA